MFREINIPLEINLDFKTHFSSRRRINVTNFGPREDCLSPLEEQRTFIILANAPAGRRLQARYDHPGGAAVQWSKENEEVVWRALGKY